MMDIDPRRRGRLPESLRALDFALRAAGHHQKSVSLDVGLVLQHAVLGDPDAVERRTERAPGRRLRLHFHRGNGDRGKNPTTNTDPATGGASKQAAEEQPPEATPERLASPKT